MARMFNDKEMEGAARQLCTLRGFDPDEAIQLPAEVFFANRVRDKTVYVPRWTLFVESIESHLQIQLALLEVTKEPRPLTDEEMVKVASRLCELRTTQPDEAIQLPLDDVLDRPQKPKTVSRWSLYAREISLHLLVEEAISRVGKTIEE